jgi:hypothetical protein
MPLVHGKKLILTLRANVPIKEFTMPVPVDEIVYQIIGEEAPMSASLAGKDTNESPISD